MTAFLAMFLVAAASAADSDPRNITTGREIPSEGYCDQPYVVITDQGHWLVTMTTGPGAEGNDKQHVVALRSTDQGRTWSEPVDIEPWGPPEASWVMPLKVPGGRIYAFYLYNADNLREIRASTEYARKRVDTVGHYMFRYSDDGGVTWSDKRYHIPIRAFEIDRENPYGGEVRYFWGVGKPMIHDGAAYIGMSKVGSLGETFIERSEGFFLRSANILTEPDPEKIVWETLPEGDIGLRPPSGPIAEEQNLVSLSEGSLYCTYRTTEGHPCHAYSRDGGRTWTPPMYMTYAPGGRLFKHSRAANFVRRFSNGKYLYWFHNHGGKTYDDRNPAWLCGGIEKDGYIHWSQPEIVLYDDDPKVRMSYPDFIEQDGQYFITETQKEIARVHPIDASLLEGLWAQHENREQATDGLVWRRVAGTLPVDDDTTLKTPMLGGRGFTIDCWVNGESSAPGRELLRGALGEGGPRFALSFSDDASINLHVMDGEKSITFSADPGVLTAPGPHHVSVIVDGGPNLVLFIVDGVLCDGGEVRKQGWYRVSQSFAEASGWVTFTLPAGIGDVVQQLTVYDRPLRVLEAVGNYRAGVTR
jgi:hypothetical protein